MTIQFNEEWTERWRDPHSDVDDNWFSLQLNKSTLPGNESLPLAYVRFIKDWSLCQEVSFERLRETDTNGDSVYQAVEDYLKKKSIPHKNIISFATDGASPWLVTTSDF